MWKKTCFLVRGGAYAFEKLAQLHCVPRLTHGSSTLTTQSTYERLPVASRRTRGPINNISFGAPVCWARRSYHHGSRYHPRVRGARAMSSSSLTMFMIRWKSFRQKVASVSIPCSWTRSVRCPAFHRPKAMLASRCAWVFSCDMIFTPKFFGLPDTQVAHSFCITDDRQCLSQEWGIFQNSSYQIFLYSSQKKKTVICGVIYQYSREIFLSHANQKFNTCLLTCQQTRKIYEHSHRPVCQYIAPCVIIALNVIAIDKYTLITCYLYFVITP